MRADVRGGRRGGRHRPRWRRAQRWLRRLRPRTMPRQATLLLLLTALAFVVAVVGVLAPVAVPTSAMVLVLLLGGFFLRIRAMGLLYLVAAAGAALTVTARPPGSGVPYGQLVLLAGTAGLVAFFVRSRERLGVQGTLGDTMLVDLRDRLRSQGAVPALPEQWHVETELRPAFGDAFSGDFVVATRTRQPDGGDHLEVVLVDVSGKGQSAGTRALLLSGAFGGLLGALPAEDFLPAANDYLLRQDWPEGFATAVHLDLDLATGEFRLRHAGHPPAGTGVSGQRWRLADDDAGPALGLLAGVDFPAVKGQLEPGAGLYVCTDGMVEVPGQDLAIGTTNLLRLAEEVSGAGFAPGAAERLVDAARVAEDDDRALVLVWRS